MLLTNAPSPVPLVVMLSAVVGLDEVLQQTPRAVTGTPPLSVTFPPEVAVVEVIAVIVVVVTVGAAACTPTTPVTTPSKQHPKTVRTLIRFLMITP
jgi:hypothetical protein